MPNRIADAGLRPRTSGLRLRPLLARAVTWCIALAGLSALLSPSTRATQIPFAPQSTISAGADGARSILAVDLDRDGDVDALSASVTDDKIAWYENDGASPPGWTPRVISTSADGAQAVFAADVDGDGDMDVLSASSFDDKIAWYESDGASPPSWTSRVISTFADGAQAVFAADVDGDGDMDVLSASSFDDKIAWYESDGASPPSWTARTISTTADGAQAVFIADVDGDGDMDVLSASSSDDKLAWYENDGASPPGWVARTIGTSADGATSIAAADVDGDGDVDALSASSFDDKIAWYENDGASPPGWVARTISTTADGAQAVSTADMDGDGDMDALSASSFDDKIAWYENDGASPPGWTARTIDTAAGSARAVIPADVDGDGQMDVLSASFGDDELAWYRNRTIHRNAVFPVERVINAEGTYSGAAADVDGDGDVDVVAGVLDEVVWHENDGGSPPGWTTRTVGAAGVFAVVYSVAAADVDGDGDLDVLSASEDKSQVPYRIAWYENNGASPPAWTARVISTHALGPESVYAADVDGDGDIDALSASGGDDRIAWYENDGASPPAWTVYTITTTADNAKSVVAADVDGDGDMDVLSASDGDHTIAWYENDGVSPPGWTKHPIHTMAFFAKCVFAADVDGDGDVDALSASHSGNKLAWYENDVARSRAAGEGPSLGWTVHTISTAIGLPNFGSAADVDGDGDVDVLSASFGTDGIAWFENDGASPPGWTAHPITTSPQFSLQVFPADVDGDGDLDVVWAPFLGSHNFGWFENRGGQFGLATADRAPASIFDGETAPLLVLTLTHNGRTGDTDLEWTSLDLLFEERPGDPLTSSEANALFDEVAIHRDDGSGEFEPGADELVASAAPLELAAGHAQVHFVDGDPEVAVALGQPQTYFVVVTMASGAATQPTMTFRVTHPQPPNDSAADDRDHDIPLRQEFAASVSSALVLVGSPAGSVPDGSGVPGTPLRIGKSATPGNLELSWAASCRGTDSAYSIYEGALGSFTSHTIKLCGTSGLTATITPGSGNRYYLVVPQGQDGDVEGSYGTASNGTPRAPGPSACRPLMIAECP